MLIATYILRTISIACLVGTLIVLGQTYFAFRHLNAYAAAPVCTGAEMADCKREIPVDVEGYANYPRAGDVGFVVSINDAALPAQTLCDCGGDPIACSGAFKTTAEYWNGSLTLLYNPDTRDAMWTQFNPAYVFGRFREGAIVLFGLTVLCYVLSLVGAWRLKTAL